MTRWSLWVMTGVLLFAFWLGARDLNTNPIWGDERNSLRDAGGLFFGPLSPVEIWERVHTGNPWHTPGYFLVLSGWGALTGWTVPMLRLLSLLFGLLALAWTYRLGRDRVSAAVGVIGAAVLGTTMLFIYYAIQIRMYSLMTALSAFTCWLYLRLVDDRHTPTRLEWAGLLAGAIGLLYTQYFAALLLGMIGLYHLLFVRKDRRWWQVTGVFVVAGVSFLPWLNGLVEGLERNAAPGDFLYRRAMDAGEAVVRFADLFSNRLPLLLVVSLLLALVGTVLLAAKRRRGALQLWFATITLTGIVLLVNEFVEVMAPNRLRYLSGVFPLLALLVGVGLAWLWRASILGRVVSLLLLVGWLLGGAWAHIDRVGSMENDGFRYMFPVQTVAARLTGLLQPGDIVVTYIPDADPLLNHHYRGVASFYFGSELNYALRRSSMGEPQADQVRFTSASARLRVWLAHQPPEPANLAAFTEALDGEFDLCRRAVDTDDLKIDLYTALPQCCLSERAEPLVRYPDDIVLMGLETLPITAEGRLPVVMTWDMTADSPYFRYSTALHVLDRDGALVAQADRGLELPPLTCRQTDIDISSLPPGTYTLHLIVYNWETGARLPGTRGDETADSLPMGQFTVGE